MKYIALILLTLVLTACNVQTPGEKCRTIVNTSNMSACDFEKCLYTESVGYNHHQEATEMYYQCKIDLCTNKRGAEE